MRKLLISVAAIGFLATPFAWAQPDHDHGHGSAPQGGGPPPRSMAAGLMAELPVAAIPTMAAERIPSPRQIGRPAVAQMAAARAAP